MRRVIELKHKGPRAQVRNLVEDRIDRIEEQMTHFAEDAVQFHVRFEENGSRTLYRVALTCHTPSYTAAAHEEGRQPGALLRKAFAEIERQVKRRNAKLRHDYVWKKSPRGRAATR